MQLLTQSENSKRAKRALENVCFDVEKIDLNEKRSIIQNMSNGDILSHVSNRYTLIKNKDIFYPFVNQFGYENVKSLFGYGNRKYYVMKINTGRQFNFGTLENPDLLDEQIVIQNSYNKTKSFSFMFGAFRLVCSNGLYSGSMTFQYKKIHVGDIPIDKMIIHVLNTYKGNTFETWQKLKERSLTLDEALLLINDFNAFNVKDEYSQNNRLNQNIRYTASWLIKKDENVDNQRNAWGLYNQLNSAINRNIYGKSQETKRINANKTMEKYLVSKVL